MSQVTTKVVVSEKTLKKLKKKGVPESYLEEMRNGTRNRIQEFEGQVCPECGEPVKLKQYPDFKCKNKHSTNVNLLVEKDTFVKHDSLCSFCGEVIEADGLGGWRELEIDGATVKVPYCDLEECVSEAQAQEILDQSQEPPTPQKPKEFSKLKMRFNSKKFKNVLENLEQIVDEAYFKADTNGLTLKLMDPSHIAMVDLSIAKSFFEAYEIEGTPDLAFEIARMLVFFKKSNADEITEINYDSDSEKIRLSTSNKKWARRYALKSLVAYSDEELPIPKISFTATIKLTSSILRDAITDLTAISDFVLMTVKDTSNLLLEADGEWGVMTYDIKASNEDILSFESKEKEVKAMYSFSYIVEMVKQGNKISDIVTIEFSKDMPIRLTYNFLTGKLIYYLAPRIESE